MIMSYDPQLINSLEFIFDEKQLLQEHTMISHYDIMRVIIESFPYFNW